MKKIIFTLTCMLIAVGCITSQAKVVEPVTKVKVKNEKEFMKALASNRVITVAKNTTLNLSKVLEDPALCNECNLVWVEEDYDHSQLSQFSTAASDYEFDGRMLTLMKLHNLTIEGEKNAEIVVNPRYAHVLNFEKCKGIRIKNLTLGHTEEGYCTGCVIGVSYSEDITIENCDLYGCGTYGIEARSTNGIEMKKSIIRDCSYGIMEIRDCKFVNFEKCDFIRNREFGLVCIGGDSQWIRFDECRWAQNNGNLFEIGVPIKLDGCEIHHPQWQTNKHKVKDLIEEQSPCQWLEDLKELPPRKDKIGPKK